MRGVTLLLSLACYVMMTYSEERRQVLTTDCNNDVVNSTMQKGDKGDVGRSGKSGISGAQGDPGSKGEPGGVGQKGMQGKSCALGSLGTEIVTRLAKIEELLTPPGTTTMATTTVTTTTPSTATSTVTKTTTSSITSCSTSTSNGPHTLTSGVEVYCEDQWTIFQRRIDGSVSFSRRWDDYANGFGQIDREFWLGLDNIHEMTRGGGCRLKIELWDFHGNQRHADYSSFSIKSAENLYRLRVSGYSGNAGDSLTYHNGHPFSTEDSDNDAYGGNCATSWGGSQGWWFGPGCFASALNGVWMRQSSGYAHGIIWVDWKGADEPLKETKMKLRCD
ncbi:microfibril-associated glycoprotein 4-like isoform X1 [Clavelina lepadiformis]|uniref:microfibril-associated glycoprotein 4-like isoform X1 n=1 Tax=Clavelina lepadiformis TaxID=159417 RepID=UPI004041098F